MRRGRAVLILLALCCLPALAVQETMSRWWGVDSTLPSLSGMTATPVDEGSVILQPYHPWCGSDASGINFCVIVTSTARLFPAMFQVVLPLATVAPSSPNNPPNWTGGSL